MEICGFELPTSKGVSYKARKLYIEVLSINLGFRVHELVYVVYILGVFLPK